MPAPYWLDLRGYDPAAAAAMLGKPMLIVQGSVTAASGIRTQICPGVNARRLVRHPSQAFAENKEHVAPSSGV